MLERFPAYRAAEQIRFFLESYFKEISMRSDRSLWFQASDAFTKTLEQSTRILQRIHERRMEQPAAPEAPARTDLYESVSQVLQAVQQEAALSNVTILKILPHDMTALPIQREHFETVLFHLIMNARLALNEKPGIIAIETSEKHFPSQENKSIRRFVLRISDTGPVFAPAELDHLFEPGAPPCPSGDGRQTHTLGLGLVKKIVDHYSGAFRVETSLRGTSFYVEFPQ